MMTEESAFETIASTPTVIEIPIEKIINGEVVEVSTKSIPIIPRKVIDPA